MIAVIDETHDPFRRSWVESANGHGDFPIQNLPLGVFSPPGGGPRAGVAIGDLILDLAGLTRTGLLPQDRAAGALEEPTLNSFLALGGSPRRALRRRLSALLSDGRHRATIEPLLHDAAACVLHLPARIGDYTDFYAGIHHARNVGRLFRPDNPLPPNYKHVPIGYHGRASSIRASGAEVCRPQGQTKAPDADAPSFGPTRRLDFELELGIWIGPGNRLAEPIAISAAQDHIAGLCLLNDWSARDIQTWEYQPLGPFLAKNFMTTISPWIVTAEALAPFRIAQKQRPAGDPAPLPYLWDAADQAHGAYAIGLEASLETAAMRADGLAPHRLSRSSAEIMYWTAAQLVTHHASGGCNLQPGDLLGSGTLSAAEPGGFGSLLEITAGGVTPITLPSGESRLFLEDGDRLSLAARTTRDGYIPIGFGPCWGVVR
jgi:fumarylacetoacetase